MSILRAAVLLVIGLLVAGCAHVPAPVPLNHLSVRVMTFNIRLDLASDGENAWPQRKNMVGVLLGHERPDIVGFQEVLLHQKRDLEAAMPGYAFYGVGRNNGREAGEFAPLAWRDDRFEALETGTFWLAPETQVPGKGWDAGYPRTATWAILKERATGVTFRVLNTHFDNSGVEARRQSARLINDWVDSAPEETEAVIVMGDFNAAPSSPAYASLVGRRLSDTRAMSVQPPYGPAGTFTGFNILHAAAEPIDHIFVAGEVRVASHATITQHWGGRLPSDHYPVMVELISKDAR
ncbi:endonuclease/exonuclease/phosphatase family protein [Qipengyuania atrilutea]|uniref:Endonuclease/exonuclease/phosphatase family protein n=1 Tax=Qipengyuania atrilutea TaxID=2744473 RepID=A0A850H4Q2_9SPHN|nr:endonuclease/exonuclease/phosphatase family protein [Actirhodobacter atriluteus]NVD45162.1 endonuclease/exonuclease/phosphatase family protein [Actirhodobacter atriluteus]